MERHWFEDVADHLGSAYLRYSFTKGTEQEVTFLIEALGLRPGDRVLDVGCGPGRHAHALGRLGLEVVGVDISERFVEIARRDAPDAVTFVRGDARHLAYDADFDAVISLCQGAFGLQDWGGGPTSSGGMPGGQGPATMSIDGPEGEGRPLDPDAAVLAGMARALRPGGKLAATAFSAYFQLRQEAPGTFDAGRGVNHERTVVKDESGRDAEVDLWTTCFTPRELRLLVAAAGLEVLDVWSVEPGDYAARPCDLDHPEFLVVAAKPVD